MIQKKKKTVAGKVYFDLREQLDQYTQRFPQTPSGVEIKIFEKLFSEEETEMFLDLSLMLGTSDAVAQLVRNVNRGHG